MAGDLYCGRCHRWLDDRSPAERGDNVCHCLNPDLSKDPNCHNPNHAHHDPESPIVLSNRAIRDAEEATELEAIRKREEAAAEEEDGMEVFHRVINMGRGMNAAKERTYEVAVFDSTTGELLGWRLLKEPEMDEETRTVLDGILEESE